MNPDVERRLNWLVDRWCAENRVPVYGYDHAHVCTSECRMLGDRPHFICTASRKVHVCGKACRNTYTTSEGTFCALTGYEVHGPDDETSTLVVRDSCGKSTRHWGDRIRTGKKRPRRASSASGPKNSIVLFERAVNLFLLSEERQALYRGEMEKFSAAVKKAAKKQCGPLVMRDASALVAAIVAKHEPLCTPPPCKTVRWVACARDSRFLEAAELQVYTKVGQRARCGVSFHDGEEGGVLVRQRRVRPALADARAARGKRHAVWKVFGADVPPDEHCAPGLDEGVPDAERKAADHQAAQFSRRKVGLEFPQRWRQKKGTPGEIRTLGHKFRRFALYR
jgi:hypothetical protein